MRFYKANAAWCQPGHSGEESQQDLTEVSCAASLIPAPPPVISVRIPPHPLVSKAPPPQALWFKVTSTLLAPRRGAAGTLDLPD